MRVAVQVVQTLASMPPALVEHIPPVILYIHHMVLVLVLVPHRETIVEVEVLVRQRVVVRMELTVLVVLFIFPTILVMMT
jgi:hypothetical protein